MDRIKENVALWMAGGLTLSWLSYASQDHLPRPQCSYSELGTLLTISHADLKKATPKMIFSSQIILGFIRSTVKVNQDPALRHLPSPLIHFSTNT